MQILEEPYFKRDIFDNANTKIKYELIMDKLDYSKKDFFDWIEDNNNHTTFINGMFYLINPYLNDRDRIQLNNKFLKFLRDASFDVFDYDHLFRIMLGRLVTTRQGRYDPNSASGPSGKKQFEEVQKLMITIFSRIMTICYQAVLEDGYDFINELCTAKSKTSFLENNLNLFYSYLYIRTNCFQDRINKNDGMDYDYIHDNDLGNKFNDYDDRISKFGEIALSEILIKQSTTELKKILHILEKSMKELKSMKGEGSDYGYSCMWVFQTIDSLIYPCIECELSKRGSSDEAIKEFKSSLSKEGIKFLVNNFKPEIIEELIQKDDGDFLIKELNRIGGDERLFDRVREMIYERTDQLNREVINATPSRTTEISDLKRVWFNVNDNIHGKPASMIAELTANTVVPNDEELRDLQKSTKSVENDKLEDFVKTILVTGYNFAGSEIPKQLSPKESLRYLLKAKFLEISEVMFTEPKFIKKKDSKELLIHTLNYIMSGGNGFLGIINNKVVESKDKNPSYLFGLIGKSCENTVARLNDLKKFFSKNKENRDLLINFVSKLNYLKDAFYQLSDELKNFKYSKPYELTVKIASVLNK